jgi:hypothetical protein
MAVLIISFSSHWNVKINVYKQKNPLLGGALFSHLFEIPIRSPITMVQLGPFL